MAESTISLENQTMISYLLNFIRYDIPILLVGKSSIGKSFTLIELAKQWHIPNTILYVGSEKADNIEGLPKITASEKNILDYFKPYWFPNSKRISEKVKNGKVHFDKFFADNSLSYDYKTLHALFSAIGESSFEPYETSRTFKFAYGDITFPKGITLTREIPSIGESIVEVNNDLADFSLFLSTLLGYGNFWLILDELDKVDDMDADKYAPMLHIVRERSLKNYSLKELNSGKGANVPASVIQGSYEGIYKTISQGITNNESLIDTRVIGIANQSENIERISDALFKRFVQVIITDLLILKPISEKLQKINLCVRSIQKDPDLMEELPLAFIKDVNLQWQFGFLPNILDLNDRDGNMFVQNFIRVMSSVFNPKASIEDQEEVEMQQMKKTAICKLFFDNYEEDDFAFDLAKCLTSEISYKNLLLSDNKELAKQQLLNDDEKILLGYIEEGLSPFEASVEVNKFIRNKIENVPQDEYRSKSLEDVLEQSGYWVTNDFEKLSDFIEGIDEEGYIPSLSINLSNYVQNMKKELFPYFVGTVYSVINDDKISKDDTERISNLVSEKYGSFFQDKTNAECTLIENIYGECGKPDTAEIPADVYDKIMAAVYGATPLNTSGTDYLIKASTYIGSGMDIYNNKMHMMDKINLIIKASKGGDPDLIPFIKTFKKQDYPNILAFLNQERIATLKTNVDRWKEVKAAIEYLDKLV